MQGVMMPVPYRQSEAAVDQNQQTLKQKKVKACVVVLKLKQLLHEEVAEKL